MSFFFRTFSILVLAAVITSCSTTNGSNSGAKSYIDMSSLAGWRGDGGQGIYICAPPKCPDLQFVMFQMQSGLGNHILKNTANSNSELAKQFELGFKIAGVGRSGKIEPDGPPREFRTKNGIQGALMPIKGTKRDGTPRDPGVMILLPAGSQTAVIVGISKTKQAAQQSAVKVANAFRI